MLQIIQPPLFFVNLTATPLDYSAERAPLADSDPPPPPNSRTGGRSEAAEVAIERSPRVLFKEC